MNIIQKPTQNFRVGRIGGYKPEVIVLHISTASAQSCISWFADPASQVSSNYLVGLDGQVYQFVKDEDTAWAQGRVDHPTSKIVISRPGVNPNAFSLSIEHEGKDLSHGAQAQLQASANLVASLCAKWNIPLNRDYVIGHREIFSLKTCPSENLGVIDSIIAMAKAINSPVAEPTTAIQVPNSKVQKVLAYLLTI